MLWALLPVGVRETKEWPVRQQQDQEWYRPGIYLVKVFQRGSARSVMSDYIMRINCWVIMRWRPFATFPSTCGGRMGAVPDWSEFGRSKEKKNWRQSRTLGFCCRGAQNQGAGGEMGSRGPSFCFLFFGFVFLRWEKITVSWFVEHDSEEKEK